MKMTLLLPISFILFITLTTQAQPIISHDYGDGLPFPINQAINFDFDEDGYTDIIINSQQGKLGITPVFLQGCLLAYEGYNATIEGVRIKVLEPGDVVRLDFNDNYYEEEEPLPLYGGDGNTLPDWNSNDAQYIGLLSFNMLSTAWMKVRIDASTETLFIMSYAYSPVQNTQIVVGDMGDVVNISGLNLTDLSVFPNPVSNMLNIELELTKANLVSFSLNTMNGQQVKFMQRELIAGKTQESMDVSNLASGIYQLVIESGGGLLTQTITISK